MARTASATLRPCDVSTSTCRSLATISSGLGPFFAPPARRRQHVHLPQLGHDLLGLVPLLRHLGPPPARSHTSGRTTSKGEDHCAKGIGAAPVIDGGRALAAASGRGR